MRRFHFSAVPQKQRPFYKISKCLKRHAIDHHCLVMYILVAVITSHSSKWCSQPQFGIHYFLITSLLLVSPEVKAEHRSSGDLRQIFFNEEAQFVNGRPELEGGEFSTGSCHYVLERSQIKRSKLRYEIARKTVPAQGLRRRITRLQPPRVHKAARVNTKIEADTSELFPRSFLSGFVRFRMFRSIRVYLRRW